MTKLVVVVMTFNVLPTALARVTKVKNSVAHTENQWPATKVVRVNKIKKKKALEKKETQWRKKRKEKTEEEKNSKKDHAGRGGGRRRGGKSAMTVDNHECWIGKIINILEPWEDSHTFATGVHWETEKEEI